MKRSDHPATDQIDSDMMKMIISNQRNYEIKTLGIVWGNEQQSDQL